MASDANTGRATSLRRRWCPSSLVAIGRPIRTRLNASNIPTSGPGLGPGRDLVGATLVDVHVGRRRSRPPARDEQTPHLREQAAAPSVPDEQAANGVLAVLGHKDEDLVARVQLGVAPGDDDPA